MLTAADFNLRVGLFFKEKSIMKKLTYETPELYVALTETDIRANDLNDSADWGGNVGGGDDWEVGEET